MVIGVGVIGAGPGAEYLHLPAIDRHRDRVRLAHIVDGGSGRCVELARRWNARSSESVESLLRDAAVDIVVVCSPPDRHAQHILAAVAAGKAAVLCEKPLATTLEDAEKVVRACAEANVALVVGTNHLFDPAWATMTHFLTDAQTQVESVAVSVSLPPNDRYHAMVGEAGGAAERGGRRLPRDLPPEVRAGILHQLVLGLAVHDLPLIRDIAPGDVVVESADFVDPLGYSVAFWGGSTPVTLTAVMLDGGADALWSIDIGTASDRITVEFPPAFIHRDGAAVTVTDAAHRTIRYPIVERSGIDREWDALLAAVAAEAPTEYEELLADARYVIDLAEQASTALRGAS